MFGPRAALFIALHMQSNLFHIVYDKLRRHSTWQLQLAACMSA